MKTSLQIIAFIASLTLIIVNAAPAPPPGDLMKKKTAYAQDILKYLAIGDMNNVQKTADSLKALTLAAGFEGKPEEYKGYGNEFIRIVKELSQEAANKNLAGSYYQFSRMISVCFACHEHIRSKLRPQKK